MQKILLVFILLTHMSCVYDPQPKEDYVFVPKTIDEVISNKEYYVTFYLNDELWWDRNATSPSIYDYNLDMSLNNFGYSGLEEYGEFNLLANRYPDNNSVIEKEYWGEQYLRIRVSQACFGIDSIIAKTKYTR